MSFPEVHTLLDRPMLLGECPLWDDERNSLYWIDIAGKAVHCFALAHSEHQSWQVSSEPGCIALCTDGRLLVAMRSGIVFLDTSTGEVQPLMDAPYDPSLGRFNDGRCDSAGRLWVGSLYDPRDKPGGTLYCLNRGKLTDVGLPVTVSNGVAFSPDGATLYHADTSAHRIKAYPFDVAAGTIGEGRDFIAFSDVRSADYGGRPDGAAVDEEGAYWCAMYEGGRLLRIAPDGNILQEVTLPVRCPTMVAFGGSDMRTMFVTSVSNKRTEAELSQFPLSGCVLALRVPVPGRLESRYIP
ncbi:SMP-30/gluconolactonase/LRE family protein [Noviherbaspirillum galbum]|uniref:SMP-30/gluconolactonase/LRE family protein n=1 Tax=Noviherbaspirillum galbum TaxID=2709383 RepID=A0A6B3SQT6_9BURK|nr:SMP-30/gluconolactonase/LRE family protein [Noviherbaspirillum galbum]NEX61116.1 SMP-30/gluconolactonase/LRE family protein [Noviherbaspirillum galbum]